MEIRKRGFSSRVIPCLFFEYNQFQADIIVLKFMLGETESVLGEV